MVGSQNKGLSEYQRRASPPYPLGAERQACIKKARGSCNFGSREGIFPQTVSRFPVANKVFLESWTVDIHQKVTV